MGTAYTAPPESCLNEQTAPDAPSMPLGGLAIREPAGRDTMSFVEFDKHVGAAGQVFQHPARQPFVVGDKIGDRCLVETELGRPRVFLLEPPSNHGVQVRHLKEDQVVQAVRNSRA